MEDLQYSKERLVQWFCGFYEGEGWVSNDIGNKNRIRLGIAQNDRTPLDVGMKIWGGSIKKRVRKSPMSDKMCVGHEWMLSHVQSLEFIKDIKPYMLIPQKIQQIERVLDTFKNGEKLFYKCDLCEKIYANPSAKSRHKKQFHQTTDASGVNTLRENQIAGSS
jgi:hypothetical protein